MIGYIMQSFILKERVDMSKMPPDTYNAMPITNQDLTSLTVVKPKKSNQIGIVIVNFLRNKLLLNLVVSIFKYQPGVKLYIVEQGIYNKELELFYDMLTAKGHEIIYAGFDAGLSHCRNLGVAKVTEPYVMWCDNDNLFLETTKLDLAIEKLKSYNLDILGLAELFDNKIRHYEVNLTIRLNQVIYKEAETTPDITRCDMCMNCCVARTEIFKGLQWDSRMKLAEHLDFFLTAKQIGMKVACSEITISNQNVQDTHDIVYTSFRNRNKNFWILYAQKWAVRDIVGLDGNAWTIPCDTQPMANNTVVQNIPKVENVKANEVIIKPLKIEQVVSTSASKILAEFNSIITVGGTSCILTKKTCAEAYKREPITNPIYIAAAITAQQKQILQSRGFDFTGNTISKQDIEIRVEPKFTTTYELSSSIEGYRFKLPCPTNKYLSNRGLL
jgi:hypothetical protein